MLLKNLTNCYFLDKGINGILQNLLSLVPIWIHLLAMAGAFGTTISCIVLSRTSLSPPQNQDDIVWRTPQLFLGLSFLTGLALVYLRFTSAMDSGTSLDMHFWSLTGCKLTLLVLAGGLSGMASKKTKSGQISSHFWLGTAAIFAVAAFLGLSV